MGSRTPPPAKPASDELVESTNFGCPMSPEEDARRRLLTRIANALQVPQATLYDPPGIIAWTGGGGVDGTVDVALERECRELLDAFRRVRDPRERRRLLALVAGVAERA